MSNFLYLELKVIRGSQDEDAGDCEGVEQLHAGQESVSERQHLHAQAHTRPLACVPFR